MTTKLLSKYRSNDSRSEPMNFGKGFLVRAASCGLIVALTVGLSVAAMPALGVQEKAKSAAKQDDGKKQDQKKPQEKESDIPCDVTDENSVTDALAALVGNAGQLNGLVNNAGLVFLVRL